MNASWTIQELVKEEKNISSSYLVLLLQQTNKIGSTRTHLTAQGRRTANIVDGHLHAYSSLVSVRIVTLRMLASSVVSNKYGARSDQQNANPIEKRKSFAEKDNAKYGN